jgi:hypothetical protein
MQTLFTLGYQGHSIATFLELLLAHGITTVMALCADAKRYRCARAAL